MTHSCPPVRQCCHTGDRSGHAIEDIGKTASNKLTDYYGVEHLPLQGHDALDDALSVAYALQHLLQAGELQLKVIDRT